MVEAKVIKKIPGYGYYPGQTGSFSKDEAESLVKAGYILIEKSEKVEKPKAK